jgi:hypothetical protein
MPGCEFSTPNGAQAISGTLSPGWDSLRITSMQASENHFI